MTLTRPARRTTVPEALSVPPEYHPDYWNRTECQQSEPARGELRNVSLAQYRRRVNCPTHAVNHGKPQIKQSIAS